MELAKEVGIVWYSVLLNASLVPTVTILLLLIPFAVMGVALVFLLLAFKMTVATGTLSGLLFYVNIVEPQLYHLYARKIY